MSLADKLDTVGGMFGAGERPTGSRDPYGLRRAAQGIVRILVDLPELTGLDLRLTLGRLVQTDNHLDEAFWSFMTDRVRFVLEQRGYDTRNVRAVTHAEIAELSARSSRKRKLEALPEFTETDGVPAARGAVQARARTSRRTWPTARPTSAAR